MFAMKNKQALKRGFSFIEACTGYGKPLKGEIYAAYRKYVSDEYDDTFSGGMFTLLAANIIYAGGIVCAAHDDEKGGASYGFAESTDELSRFRGDVNICSAAHDIFGQIAKYLDTGRIMLFYGAPCGVAALLTYLERDYENLYCIDNFCSGSAAAKAIRAPGKYAGRPLFGKKISIRSACDRCAFKYPYSRGDITIGIFNGIGEIMPEMEGEHKTALVAINSSKGQTLFDYVKNYTIYRESCDLQIANGKLIES